MKDNWVPRDMPQPSSPMFADASNGTASNWSAVRSALVAEVLRRDDRPRVRGQIHGESMLPALWPGDVVEIESCLLEELRSGEIVLAQRDDRLVLHRLVRGRGPNRFVLRGDCVRSADPEYTADALLGRLVRRGTEQRNASAPAKRPALIAEWFGAKWSRAVGILFCYCSLLRRGALKLHSRWKTSTRDLPTPKHSQELVALELNSAEITSAEAGAS
jgi:hypothetical protein